MVSSARRIWLAAPPIVRAALHAAWAASKVDAISLASLFTIVNLAFGTYEVAEEHLRILELPGIVVDGTVIFVLSLLFSFVITVPVSSVIATCAYPLLRTLGAADQRASGIVGFLVGTRLARHVVEWTSRESILRILDFLVRGRRSRRLRWWSCVCPTSSPRALTPRPALPPSNIGKTRPTFGNPEIFNLQGTFLHRAHLSIQ